MSVFAHDTQNVTCPTIEAQHDGGEFSHDAASVGEHKLGMVVGGRAQPG